MARRRTPPQRLPDAVRDAVERTIQTTLGGAQQTRGRAQEALDDVVHGAEAGAKTVRARVREAIETTRPATSDDIRELREEIGALAARLDALEGAQGAGRSAPARGGATGRKTTGTTAKRASAARSTAAKRSSAAGKSSTSRSTPARKGSSRSPKR